MFPVNGKCAHGGYSKKNGEIKAGNTDFAAMLDDKAEEVRDDLVEEKGFFILPGELFCNVRAKAANDEN